MHKMAITISELQARVNKYQEDCFDNYAALKGLIFEEPFGMTFQAGEDNLFGKGVGIAGKLTDWAFDQIAERLDAPHVRWLSDPKHCPSDLRIEIMNKLVGIRPDARLFVRSKGDVIRGVLSDEYTKFDNKPLVDMVAQAIAEMGVEPEVHRTEVGDEIRSYVLLPQVKFAEDPTKPIVSPNGTQGELPNMPGTSTSFVQSSPYGDGGLHPAIYITNSERGGGKARVVGAVFRYVCGNGLIWGWNAQDVFAIRHRWISEGAMAILVAEAVGVAFKLSESAAMKFMASQEQRLEPKSLKPMIEDWATRYGLTIDAKENWLAVASGEAISYGRQGDPRLFDLVNAATYVAQSRTPDEREMMERMAGDLLR